MQSKVTEIALDVFRISTFHPEYGIQFNQFVIRDEQPFLMHTGFRKTFPVTLEAVRTVMDPATLRWIGFSHFESDECGALNSWLAAAPEAEALCSFVGAVVCVNDFGDRPARPMADGEVLPIGKHRLRFLATPHVPHGWDAGLFFDEMTQTLLCSDLFFQPGDPEPLAGAEIVGRARDAIAAGRQSPLAKDMPYTPYTRSTLDRLAGLKPRCMAVMHGSSFEGDGEAAIGELAGAIDELLGRQG